MAVLALVIVLLLGVLLVNQLTSMRQRAAFDDLTQQYSTLSGAYDELEESCAALEQTARDAQGRVESAERELEALRRSPTPTPTPTPEPTPTTTTTPTPTPTPTQTPAPTPTLVPAEQSGMSDAAQSAKENE